MEFTPDKGYHPPSFARSPQPPGRRGPLPEGLWAERRKSSATAAKEPVVPKGRAGDYCASIFKAGVDVMQYL